MVKELLKKISFFVSVGLIFVVGLLFIILGDLILNSGSPWLIGAVIIAFGSAACFIVGEIYRERKVVLWVLKGVGLALAIAFIGYCVGFYFVMARAYAAKLDKFAGNTAIFITMMVLSSLAVVAQVTDIVFTAVLKEE